MKKALLFLVIIGFAILACNNNKIENNNSDSLSSIDSVQTNADTKTNAPLDTQVAKNDEIITSAKSDIAEGELLIDQSDCLGCHKLDQKLVGPAYFDVAKKYDATDANMEYLINKIYTGGSGVWGELPMAAHHALTKEQLRKMVSYILSLRKQD